MCAFSFIAHFMYFTKRILSFLIHPVVQHVLLWLSTSSQCSYVPFRFYFLFHCMPCLHFHGLNRKINQFWFLKGKNNCCCCWELKKWGSWNIYLKWLEDRQGFCWSIDISWFQIVWMPRAVFRVYKVTSIAAPAALFGVLHIDRLFESSRVKAHRLERVQPKT